MAATVSMFIHLHDDDQIDVDTMSDGSTIRVTLDVGTIFVTPAIARRVAAHLLAAAEHVDPDPVDTDAIARTLAIATGGAA